MIRSHEENFAVRKCQRYNKPVDRYRPKRDAQELPSRFVLSRYQSNRNHEMIKSDDGIRLAEIYAVHFSRGHLPSRRNSLPPCMPLTGITVPTLGSCDGHWNAGRSTISNARDPKLMRIGNEPSYKQWGRERLVSWFLLTVTKGREAFAPTRQQTFRPR
jgi:hypothetical protein